jgi:hypothetical protein
MNLCLLCEIVVDAPKLYALESLVSSLAPKSASSSQPPPQQSSKLLLSYAPNSPLLLPTPAPMQEPNDIDVPASSPNQAPIHAPDDNSNKFMLLVRINIAMHNRIHVSR